MTAQSEPLDFSTLVEVAQEQLRWQKVALIPTVKEVLVAVLESKSMRVAYETCDGRAAFREVAAAARVSVGTVSNWTRRWRELGVAYEDDAGRIRHLVSLGALGVPLETG